MYNLTEMAASNEAFWTALRSRLARKGIDVSDVQFQGRRPPVPDSFGDDVYFSQLCGYPFVTRFSGQGSLLGTPCYAFPGCEGATHVAYFLVRDEDPAVDLQGVRGRIFGCNSLLSNSGMNLPRLAIARLAGGEAFFSSVLMTGGHNASVDRLLDGTIDVCSVDCVTWGFFRKHRPGVAARLRVLDETPRSPSLPFVTSATTPMRDRKALAECLLELISDPQTSEIREKLHLTGIVDIGAPDYLRVLDFEAEAARLGYPAIR